MRLARLSAGVVQGRSSEPGRGKFDRRGFYVPFQKSERRYRRQLDATGFVCGMVLGRPLIPAGNQYPTEHFRELAGRDQQILDSFRAEYERRRRDEAAEVKAISDDPEAIVAHVVCATG